MKSTQGTASDTINAETVRQLTCAPEPPQTDAQRRHYWGVVIKNFVEKISDHQHTKDEAHRSLARRFLCDRTDDGVPFVRSTATLSKAEFSRYIEQLHVLAAEYGHPIGERCPDSEPVLNIPEHCGQAAPWQLDIPETQ